MSNKKKEEVVHNVKIRYLYFTDEEYVLLINQLWTCEFNTSAYLSREVEKTEILWKLFKCVKLIKHHHQIYLNKRAEILSKYGTHDSASNNWIIDKRQQTEALGDINILNDSIVELNITKMDASDFMDNEIFSPNFGGFQNVSFKILNQMEDWVDWASIDTWIIKNKKKEE